RRRRFAKTEFWLKICDFGSVSIYKSAKQRKRFFAWRKAFAHKCSKTLHLNNSKTVTLLNDFCVFELFSRYYINIRFYSDFQLKRYHLYGQNHPRKSLSAFS
ncbi:hypothetical protein, partial [Ruminococcus sp.]|uniref:hypothetical protein n=1 Tax=Ruminococcus sp. TaxID=41978 RepID=UPI003890FE4C